MSYNPNSRKIPIATSPAGSTFVGDNNSYSNFTPSTATVKSALSAIDTALGAGFKANTTLSNLTSPTAINQDLLFGADGVNNIGALGASRPGSVFVENQVRVGIGTDTPAANTLLFLDDNSNSQTVAAIVNANTTGTSSSTALFLGSDLSANYGVIFYLPSSRIAGGVYKPNQFGLQAVGGSSLGFISNGDIEFSNGVDFQWKFSGGNLLTETDGTGNIGALGASRPGSVFVENQVRVGIGTQTSFGSTLLYLDDNYSGPTVGAILNENMSSVARTLFYVGADQGSNCGILAYNGPNYTGSGPGDGPNQFKIETGGAAELLFLTYGAVPISIGINAAIQWMFSGSNGDFLAYTDGTNNIGAPSANRPNNLYLANSLQALLVQLNGSSSGYVGLQSPATPTSYTLTVPSVAPTPNQVLAAGSGTPTNLTWAQGPSRGTYGTSGAISSSNSIVGLTANNLTMTLPAANSLSPGDVIIIKDESNTATTGNDTINTAGSDTIDNGVILTATSITITTNGGFFRLYSDGVSQWFQW